MPRRGAALLSARDLVGRVLVVDAERGLREMLRVLLGRAGLDVTVAENVKSARARLSEDAPYDAVVTDLLMPDGSGMDVLREVRGRSRETQVVLITAHAATERAVEALRDGARGSGEGVDEFERDGCVLDGMQGEGCAWVPRATCQVRSEELRCARGGAEAELEDAPRAWARGDSGAV